MSLIRNILALLLTIVIAGFAIMNRDVVSVMWSPVHAASAVPLYGVILAALAVGFLMGAVATWIGSAGLRRTKRAQKKQIKKLEKELNGAPTLVANNNPPAELFPAIPTQKSA